MRLKKNVFWGILFLLAAGALIVDRLGVSGEAFSFWELIVSAFLAALAISGGLKRNWGTALFSLAFLAIVNDELLQIEQLTPWPVLGAALLGTIGLNMLFPRRRKMKDYTIDVNIPENSGADSYLEDYCESVGENGETVINCNLTFASTAKYLQCENLAEVNMNFTFGKMEFYFQNVQLYENRAQVNISATFGNTELYVPKEWKVICNPAATFGHVKEYGTPVPDGENELRVDGDITFGSVNVHYV